MEPVPEDKNGTVEQSCACIVFIGVPAGSRNAQSRQG